MTCFINHGPTNFPELNIEKIEKLKNAKFVCELSIKGKFGWTDSPAQIYYQENPPLNYSNYFALIYQLDTLLITSGESVFGIPIEGIQTPSGEIIYSRFSHDFRKADSHDVYVDGGLYYTRLVGDFASCKHVVLTIKKSELVVVTDPDEIKGLYEAKKIK